MGEMPDPQVREDDVLVQVHAAGVNPLDSKIAAGEFKLILPHRFWGYSGCCGSGLPIRIDQRGDGLRRTRTCKRQGRRQGEIENRGWKAETARRTEWREGLARAVGKRAITGSTLVESTKHPKAHRGAFRLPEMITDATGPRPMAPPSVPNRRHLSAAGLAQQTEDIVPIRRATTLESD